MRTIYRTGFPIVRESESDTLAAAAGVCLKWALERSDVNPEYRTLSKNPFHVIPRTSIGGSHAIETRMLQPDGNRSWAMRFTHPHRDEQEIDEKIEWRTEIGISEMASSLTFCCSVSVGRIDSTVAPVRFYPTRPRVILEMLKQFSCGGKVKLREKPYVLKDDASNARLFRGLLESTSRQHPVVFVTPRVCGSDYAANYGNIASELAGLAYVVVASCPEASRMLAGELPSQLNCYNGGVRIYWPDFSVSQSPYQHPLWLWWKIRQFQERHPAAFAKELLKQISAVSVLSVHPDWLTWSAVESHERAQAIMQAKSAGDNEKLLNIYIQDKEALESTIAKLQSHIDAKSRELQIAYAKINAFESALEKAKTKKSDLDADHSLLPPTSVRESVQRAKSMFKNRLTFCLNSKSEVDKCAFEEPEDLLAALAWLANVYYDSKAGIKCGTPLRQSIKESLSDWFYSGGQSEQTIGEFKEWYHCQLNGRKWELGEHIGTGTSKDARQTIRVGFTWDKDGKQVIIGFIGQHQRSRKT